MLVVCVEGSHGCGKTELCTLFEKAGYCVLDEAFLDMPAYALHPQSLLMETSWVVSWFTRLLKKASELKKTSDGREPIYIADRSPFSAVFYASKGHLLEEVIREQLREVQEHADILIFTVYLQVQRETLWQRIQDRLKREPSRVRYNEDKREWMESTLDFYDHFKWDMTVPNTHVTIPELLDSVVSTLSARSERFRRSASPMEEFRRLSSASSSAASSASSDSGDDDRASTPPSVGAGAGAGGVGDDAGVGLDADLSPTRPLTDERAALEAARLSMDPIFLHKTALAST